MAKKKGPSFGAGVSKQEAEDLTKQPLDSDGWSSDRFDELYGKDKNPHKGTERDRVNRKSKNIPGVSEKYKEEWERIFGKKKNENNRRTKRKV